MAWLLRHPQSYAKASSAKIRHHSEVSERLKSCWACLLGTSLELSNYFLAVNVEKHLNIPISFKPSSVLLHFLVCISSNFVVSPPGQPPRNGELNQPCKIYHQLRIPTTIEFHLSCHTADIDMAIFTDTPATYRETASSANCGGGSWADWRLICSPLCWPWV